MMDGGCYTVNVLLHYGGAIEKVTKATPTIFKENIDSAMEAEVLFKSGATGKLVVNFKKSAIMPTLLSCHAVGEAGEAYCNNLIGPSYWHYITVTKKDGSSKTIKDYGDGNTTYYYQLKAFCEEVNGGSKCETTPTESVEIMKIIDMVYENPSFRGNLFLGKQSF
jgi:predicted dehydrogenase